MLDTTDYKNVKTGFEIWHVEKTDTTDYVISDKMTLVSAELVDGCIEIVRRYPYYTDLTPSHLDRFEKEIYEASTIHLGIVLIKIIKGRIVPGYHIDEQIEFEE